MIEHAGGRVVFAPVDDVPWTDEADVVVVGSGAAGWSAALAASEAGASVLVLEKCDAVGGTTAKAGGECGVAEPGALPAVQFLVDAALADPGPSGGNASRALSRPAVPRRSFEEKAVWATDLFARLSQNDHRVPR